MYEIRESKGHNGYNARISTESQNIHLTKNKVEDAILFFAEKYDKKENYKHILKFGLYQSANMIVNEMFCQEFLYNSCTDEEYINYSTILLYLQTMRDKGEVIFN